jgi:hypothetical protein
MKNVYTKSVQGASSKIFLKTFASRKITHTCFEVCILRHIINGFSSSAVVFLSDSNICFLTLLYFINVHMYK